MTPIPVPVEAPTLSFQLEAQAGVEVTGPQIIGSHTQLGSGDPGPWCTAHPVQEVIHQCPSDPEPLQGGRNAQRNSGDVANLCWTETL